MKACATAGGGVMFIPDELERKSDKLSFADFVDQEIQPQKRKLFGRRSSEKKSVRKAA